MPVKKNGNKNASKGENNARAAKSANATNTTSVKSDHDRIESDIVQFHQNVLEVKINDDTRDVVELAKQYFEDTQYFLDKKDFVTAFGCINYAHGLIDAYRKKWRD